MDQMAATRETYVTGLKNAHAMETQALSVMKPQLGRLDDYPDVKERLQGHIQETEGQVQRLEGLLEANGTDKSTLKDLALSIGGALTSLGNAAAGDAVLKSAFADFAFENYEIAAYRSLITMAERAGDQSAISVLQQNLAEEEAMASWLQEHLPDVTNQYLALEAAEKTKH